MQKIISKTELTELRELKREIKALIRKISQELVQEFGKTPKEAQQLIKETKVVESLIKDRIGLHESPYHWAIIILSDVEDFETLEKYLYD